MRHTIITPLRPYLHVAGIKDAHVGAAVPFHLQPKTSSTGTAERYNNKDDTKWRAYSCIYNVFVRILYIYTHI